MKLSIIIPLYNEQTSIIQVLTKVLEVKFPDFIENTEIVIVDDSSTDDSFKNVEAYIQGNSNIKLIQHHKNLGKGAAVKTGLQNASGDVFLIQDADLELDPRDLPSMLIAMKELNVEFINGSRYLAGVSRPLASYKRFLANKLFTFLTSVLIDTHLTDMACGYKLFTRNLYEKLELKENRFGFEAEFILKSIRLVRNNVAEVPVRYFPRQKDEGKKLGNLDALKILKTIFKYGFRPKISTNNLILLMLIAISISVFNLKLWKKENRVIEWDSIAYYSYVPATFIYHDLTLEIPSKQKGVIIWPIFLPNGKKVTKTSMGLAYLYTPFFVLGHITAAIKGSDMNGYSKPYKFWFVIGILFYLWIGLLYLKRILQKFYPRLVVNATLLSICFGTNILIYVIEFPMFAHVYGFTLVAMYIYFTLKWHEKANWQNSIRIGLLLGLISLIRPINALFVLFLVLYDVKTIKELWNRVKLFFNKFVYITIITICTLLVWVPQLLYWKYITGSYWFYSYMDESFYFKSPQIIRGLFGFRNGWLLYTPIMIFALIGIGVLYKKQKAFFLPILIIFILNTYIILSWWCWWYTGYGHRAFIDSYSLMAIPLAAFINWGFYNIRSFIRKTSLIVVILLIFHSVFESFQFHNCAIHYNAMNKEAYFESFGRINATKRYWSKLTEPDYERAKKGLDRDSF